MGILDSLNLPTLDQQPARACPKPQARVKDRVAARTERDRKGSAFRSEVWARDESRCRLCGRRVSRTVTLCREQGHVHHLRGRNVAPEDRYNAKAAILVCASCHQDIHAGKVRPK